MVLKPTGVMDAVYEVGGEVVVAVLSLEVWPWPRGLRWASALVQTLNRRA